MNEKIIDARIQDDQAQSFCMTDYSASCFATPEIATFSDSIEEVVFVDEEFHVERTIPFSTLLDLANSIVALLDAEGIHCEDVMESCNMLELAYRKVARDAEENIKKLTSDYTTVYGRHSDSGDLVIRHYFAERKIALRAAILP
jgi:hypothetical protein